MGVAPMHVYMNGCKKPVCLHSIWLRKEHKKCLEADEKNIPKQDLEKITLSAGSATSEYERSVATCRICCLICVTITPMSTLKLLSLFRKVSPQGSQLWCTNVNIIEIPRRL